MPKPNNILLSDFINTHKEDFISFELWVVDDLTDFMVSHFNLLASDLSLIVDIDEEDPFAGLEDSKISLRFNGRFSPPKEDKQGKDLAMNLDGWVEKLKEWFSNNDVKIFFNEDLKDIIKFTLFIPAMDVPEPVLRENEQDKQDQDDQADESATPSSDEVDDSGKSEPETSDNTEQKESEKPEEKSEESEPKTPKKSEKTKPETEVEQSEDISKKESDDELKEFEKALGL
jgi:cobalamin biosynthesis protein CobT